MMKNLIDTTCAVEGFGEAECPHPKGTRRLPEISLFLVVFAGFASKYYQKRMIFGGLAALQRSLRRRLRNYYN
jgi:hypothetical protein